MGRLLCGRVKGEPGSRSGSHRGSHSGSHQGSGKTDEEPYRLRAVGHSLGGASLLIYAVTRCMKGQPTHLARLILLTPAGFQQNYPKVWHHSIAQYVYLNLQAAHHLWRHACTQLPCQPGDYCHEFTKQQQAVCMFVCSHVSESPPDLLLFMITLLWEQQAITDDHTLFFSSGTGCCTLPVDPAPSGVGPALVEAWGGGSLLHPLLSAALCDLQADSGHAAYSCPQ